MDLRPIRVLIVDDSALMRKLLSDVLAADPAIEVVGFARNGHEAIAKADSLRPDVMTLDVEMPELDGTGALKAIMEQNPRPIIMVSSLTFAGAETTLTCLQLGAVDFVGKPAGLANDLGHMGADLVAKVKAAASAKIHVPRTPIVARSLAASNVRPQPGLVVIGSSTGGPNALSAIFPLMPLAWGVPIVVVQHMPAMFTSMLASRLDQESEYAVREVEAGDQLDAGTALVARGGSHLEFDEKGVAHVTQSPPVHSVRPSIDVALMSLAAKFAPRMVAVILTGMGRDGAQGAKMIHCGGGHVIAQDEATSVVYGMPKAAVELGAVDVVRPLDEIPGAIAHALRHLQRERRAS